MKTLGWVLTGLVLLVMALGMQVMGRTRSVPGCASSVVIGQGPRGEPVECVCVEGVVSTCFDPGP